MLIRSLDSDSATVLLSQLSAEEARAVRDAMRELGSVDPAEQEELRNVLRRPEPTDEPADHTGVELTISAPSLHEPELPTSSEPLHTSTVLLDAPQPFAWLEGNDLPSLAAMLEREHLSTVAVVLSHLEPERASEVLAALPPRRRAAAIERLADLGESDRSSLEVIERQLADWIATQKAERQRRADRLTAIQSILKHSSPQTCQAVLSDISQHDRALVAEIGDIHGKQSSPKLPEPALALGEQASGLKRSERAGAAPPGCNETSTAEINIPREHAIESPIRRVPSFAFGQLTQLNDQQLAKLFAHCPSDCVVKALASAPEAVTKHVERSLPKSLSKELRRRMHGLSAVRLSDLTEAQQQVAEVAGQLFGAGLARPKR